MINVALPKGRLGEKVYQMFAKAGFECTSILENNRKLIFENKEKNVRHSDDSEHAAGSCACDSICGRIL